MLVLTFNQHSDKNRVDPLSYFVPASAPRLVKQRTWYVLSCVLDDAYKITLAANRKE